MFFFCSNYFHLLGQIPDITHTDFLSSDIWEENKLPGNWTRPSEDSKYTRILENKVTVFGLKPDQVIASIENSKIKKIDLIYLEGGTFFGYSQSQELKYQKINSNDSIAIEEHNKKINDLSLEEAKKTSKIAEFNQRFVEIRDQLKQEIYDTTSNELQSKLIGKSDEIKTRIFYSYYSPLKLNIQLLLDEQQLIQITLIRSEDSFSRLGEVLGSAGSRKIKAKENVKSNEHGDRFISNIPLHPQGGRGYCAMATLAMISNYFNISVGTDFLVTKAKYRYGLADNASIISTYKAIATEGKLKFETLSSLDFDFVQKSIEQGIPILVWRWFDRERDEFHTKFSKMYILDSSLKLPDPKAKSEQVTFPPKFRPGWVEVFC